MPPPLRPRLDAATRRLHGAGRSVLQSALAAGLAWSVATTVFGYRTPFFAPAAAVVTLGTTLGRRGRRAVEMAIGVAVGIAIADLIVLAIGTGALQIALVVGLAMAAAVLLGGGTVLVNQAAVSAILVATLQPPTVDLVPHRFFHTLIGAATALLVGQVLLPLRPVPIVLRAAQPVFQGLAAALERTAVALQRGDQDEAEAALLDARAMDPQVRELQAALGAAVEAARLSPTRRGTRQQLTVYADAVTQVDLAVRNTRVLARAAWAVLRHGDGEDPDRAVEQAVGRSVAELAAGVRSLGDELAGTGDSEAATAATRRHALAAAERTSAMFPDAHALALSRAVGTVRATAIDLLRCSGLSLGEALQALDERTAADEASGPDGPGGSGLPVR
jgi:uncharacterized membrane protein YgaE (UPF0421/DUF939 family)